jgi:hypothetical protein
MFRKIKNGFLISLLLIGILGFLSAPTASAQDTSAGYSLAIKRVDYPFSVQLGDDIPIEITVEHYLLKATGFHIFIYQKGAYTDIFEKAQIASHSGDVAFPSNIKWIIGSPEERPGVSYYKVGRELGETTVTVNYPYPESASRTVELVVDAYATVPYLIHREEFVFMDTKTISINVDSDRSWGMVVNGGFENWLNGWELDNRSGGTYITTGIESVQLAEDIPRSQQAVPVSSSPCLKLHVYKHAAGSSMRTGIDQVIPETILDGDAQISFKARSNVVDTNIFRTALSQVSVVFEDAYRINYQILAQDTEHQSPLPYREFLPNEANILVTEPTLEWQYIDRNLKDDFVSSFGSSALRPFSYVTVIAETASMGMYFPPSVYIDDISLTKTSAPSQPQETTEPPTVPEPTTEPPEEPAPTTTPEETPTVTEEAPLVQEGFTLGTTELGIIGVVIVALIAIVGFLSYSRRKK